MIRVICIDATKKPKGIPAKKWITEGTEYHVIHVSIHTLQGGIQGVTLSEICLDESCHPYETFKLSRFAIHIDDLDRFVQLCQECSGLSKVDIEELIRESELETIE